MTAVARLPRLLVRDAGAGDLAALSALRAPEAQHRRKLREAEAGTLRFFVAASGTDIVGFATLHLLHPIAGAPKSRLPKLSDGHVAAAYRRRGVGRSLVEAREEAARAHGFELLYVSVDPEENPGWLAFFQRRGYEPLQESAYRVREPRYRASGESYRVDCWRIDLVARFR